jgi:hypothetical protein
MSGSNEVLNQASLMWAGAKRLTERHLPRGEAGEEDDVTLRDTRSSPLQFSSPKPDFDGKEWNE